MICHQGLIYLYGGYYDAGDELPKYYNDLWVFDPSALTWGTIGDMRSKWPQARSGFQWVARGEFLVMHGGYSKKQDVDDADMEHGVTMEDTWTWHVPTSKVRLTKAPASCFILPASSRSDLAIAIDPMNNSDFPESFFKPFVEYRVIAYISPQAIM
jgi:hypothetical protein